MLSTINKTFSKVYVALAVTLSLGATMPAEAQEKTLKIGWTAWADAEAITQVTKAILEQRLDYKVDLVMTDIALQFQGVARGQLDMMEMAWLPTTHKAYWEKVQNDVVDLGVIYDKAKIGWVVPAYIPESELKTLDDLNKPSVKEKLKNHIQGIDPGAGLMGLSKKAIVEYKLSDYKLSTASDAAMNIAVDRAVAKNEWIVALSWTPHWMFSKHKLRYLEDPKGVFGGAEDVHVIGRKGIEKDHPKVAALMKNMKMPLSELQAIMYKAKDSSAEKEAVAWVKANGPLVDKWLDKGSK